MATFATNFTSCSAEDLNVLSWGCVGAEFWCRIEAYDFWLSHTCCLNACFLYAGPFVGCNMWSFAIAAFWLLFLYIWASFMVMALPTDETFSFGPTWFGRMTETLAVPALLYGNWSRKFFHPINNTYYWTA